MSALNASTQDPERAACQTCCRYILAYLESTIGIRRGSRTWQMAFGSGFKVNSAVWRALGNNTFQHPAFADDDKSN